MSYKHFTFSNKLYFKKYHKNILQQILRWCLIFWPFAEINLFSEFRLFVFLLFHDLL